MKTRIALVALLGLALAGAAQGDLTDSLKAGTPDLKSATQLAFGPDGVLFVGDPQGAAIFAIATGDTKPSGGGALKVEGIGGKVASLLGTEAQQILINDMRVNPASGNVYLAVGRGKGPDALPAIVKVDRDGKLSEVALKDVKFSKSALPNPSTKTRQESITNLGYVSGKVLVSGLSNEDWASTLRVIPFPFSEASKGTGVEIFHGAHGKFETAAPIRTFVSLDVKGQTNILAAYTCTPLVKFSVDELKPGTKVKGTTIAELGNGNRPLDMITYDKDGKTFILIANNKRGIMKVTTDGIDTAPAITKGVGGPSGQKYETIDAWKGVEQLDKLDKDNALVIIRGGSGSLDLVTLPLP